MRPALCSPSNSTNTRRKLCRNLVAAGETGKVSFNISVVGVNVMCLYLGVSYVCVCACLWGRGVEFPKYYCVLWLLELCIQV